MRTKAKRADELATVQQNGTSSTQWIRADHIRIDPDAQRALRPEWVRFLAENFDETKLGIIHVSRRRDAFYAMDGQHRIFACRLRGEPTRLLECKVYEGLTKPEEAQIFNGINTTKAVRYFDQFRVRLNYDADAQAILKMIEAVGLKLSDQAVDGNITAVKACEDVYFGRPFRSKEPTPWALARALRTLTSAWGSNRDAVSGHMVHAAGAVHLRYGDDLDLDMLARKLSVFPGGPLGLAARARIRREVTGTTLWRAVAEVMVDVYNKGLRKNPLPDWNR